jgi:hypothetical protein
MKRNFFSVLTVGLISLGLTTAVLAKDKKPKEQRLDGRIQMVNKDESKITLKVGNITRDVMYTPSTQWTKLNKPGSMDEIKEGARVICVGTMNSKGQLDATRCDARGN